MQVKGYLIVRADGSMRTAIRRVQLRIDEVAFPLTVTVPAMWGQVQKTTIDVTLPEPPEARVTVGGAELDDSEAAGG